MEDLGAMKIVISFALILVFLFSASMLTGCSTTSGEVAVGWGKQGKPCSEAHPPSGHHGHGPPPHAPAWGYRAKHQFRYYPDSYVYFDVTNKVYFYLEGVSWRTSALLPVHYQERLGGYVLIEADTDRPYTYFDKHRKEYPPGHWKKGKNKKNKRH